MKRVRGQGREMTLMMGVLYCICCNAKMTLISKCLTYVPVHPLVLCSM